MTQHQWTVPASAAGEPLLEFLAGALAVSRRRAKALLDARSVFVNDRRVWMARHRLRAGDRVEARVAREAERRPPILLVYEDDVLVIADKPAGRISNGPDSVESDLREILGSTTLAAVHRLDRDTTGCLIFARESHAAGRMVEIFREKAVTKVYRAIVRGTPSPRDGAITRPLEGKQARTEYRVVAAGPRASQVRICISTGRTHQIRKHFAAIGHPVAGDPVYATTAIRDPALKHLPRQMLHAESIRFRHPVSGEVIEATSPLPPDFRQALAQLEIRG